MKKKILSAMFAVALMAVAGFNVYMNQTKSNFSELALANIEALAYNYGEAISNEEYIKRTGCSATIVLTYCIAYDGKTHKYAEKVK